MTRYNSYRTYLTKRFGGPVLKVPVNGGFSCPNRDGTTSSIGCTFCDNRAFSPAAQTDPKQAVEQLEKVIEKSARHFQLFMPYLQPFSNTYGKVDSLRSIYQPLIDIPKVIGLSIGTRPDCFSDEIYQYLEELSQRTYLVVELGLQSSLDDTLSRINRGHTFQDFVQAAARLSQNKIYTVAHVMLGLPGENREMMMQTAQHLAGLPVQGVKIHQLMIIKDTPLEEPYRKKEIEVFSLDDYAVVLAGFIAHLRPDQHIHRLMADSQTINGLIAPDWSSEKSRSMAFIQKYFDDNKVIQGSAFHNE